jgi:hypothetical protein
VSRITITVLVCLWLLGCENCKPPPPSPCRECKLGWGTYYCPDHRHILTVEQGEPMCRCPLDGGP